MNEHNDTFHAPLTAPDPFALPKEVRVKVKSCCGGTGCVDRDKVEYLWLNVGKRGLAQPGMGAAFGQMAPTLEHWLNVIDEAASVGAKSLVVSVETSLDAFPELAEVCQWAQDAHGMCVAIHTTADSLGASDVALLKRLDTAKVRLFVSHEAYPNMAAVEASGVKVCIADAHRVDQHGCGMPQKMLFVNGDGQLYTCGMVAGKAEFHLGSIYNRPFGKVVVDPALPHSIPLETPFEEHGCDGCPPLLSELLKTA